MPDPPASESVPGAVPDALAERAEPVLAGTGLTVGYRRREVLRDVSVALHRGELACLVGANGIGKSTLLRTLVRAQPALAGTVRVGGRPIGELRPRELARQLAVVLTDRVAVGQLRGYDLAALGRYPYTAWFGQLDAADRRVVDRALATAGAEQLADRPVVELSDGERQRLMIARALAQEPAILVLDEPTAFLDVRARIELTALLLSLTREHGLAVLMSTHDLEHMLRHADAVWLITPERRLEVGAPEDLGLAGTLQRAVAGTADFDPATGTFRAARGSAGTARVTGDGEAATWTRRALERAGYRLVDGPGAAGGTGPVDLEVDPPPGGEVAAGWLIRDRTGHRTVASLAALVTHTTTTTTTTAHHSSG